MARYTTNISIKTDKETVSYGKDKNYTEMTKIEKVFDSNDAFDTLLEFEAGSISNKFRDCKGILICNTGNAVAELQLTKETWVSATNEDTNGADVLENTYLTVGDCIYLPHNRFVGYDAVESAGNADGNQKVATQNHIIGAGLTGVLVNMASGTTAGDTTGLDAITVDTTSALIFKPGDYLALGVREHNVNTEIIQVVTVDSETQITVKRGQLGTTPINHADDSPIYFWYGNSYMPVSSYNADMAFVVGGDSSTASTITDGSSGFLTSGFKKGDLIYIDNNGEDNDQTIKAIAGVAAGTLTLHINNLNVVESATATKLQTTTTHTDHSGRFAASNFFGVHRNVTGVAEGIVPGSVAIQFNNPAALHLGLNNLGANTETGLTASDTYTFKLNIDGIFADLSVTTDASNSLFTGKNGLIEKLNQAIEDAVSAGTYPSGAVVSMVGGDIIITSKTAIGQLGGQMADNKGGNLSRGYSQIQLSATGSGTSLLGSGRIPSGAFKEKYPLFMDQDLYPYNDSSVAEPNAADMLIDQGDGTLIRKKGGIGTINYDTGAIDFQGCPPISDFRVWGTGRSALAGVMRTADATSNCIEKIAARSMNPVANAKLLCIILS